MADPIETVAEALNAAEWEVFVAEDGMNAIRRAAGGLGPTREDQARAVFASLAQHRDDIARVLREHTDIGPHLGRKYVCFCDRWPYDEADDDTDEAFLAHQADAVLAYLTGEVS